MNMTKRHRALFFLLMVFGLPVIISILLFYFHDHIPFKTMNHGVLINPPIQVEANGIAKTRTWQVVYLPGQSCDAECEKYIYLLGQIKKAVGKDKNRVEVSVINQHPINNSIHQITLNTAQLMDLQKRLPSNNSQSFDMQHKVYLIDPSGFLFMYYVDTDDPMHILKDLKRVLEVSQIG